MGIIEDQIRQNIAQRHVIHEEPKAATAAALATKKLRRLGLTRENNGSLWRAYRELYFSRRA